MTDIRSEPEAATNWQQFAGDLMADLVPPPFPIGPHPDDFPDYQQWVKSLIERYRADHALAALMPEVEAALDFVIEFYEVGGNGEGWTLQEVYEKAKAARARIQNRGES